MATMNRHHEGETDPAKVIAETLRNHLAECDEPERFREAVAAWVIRDLKAAGYTFIRKLTKAECEECR